MKRLKNILRSKYFPNFKKIAKNILENLRWLAPLSLIIGVLSLGISINNTFNNSTPKIEDFERMNKDLIDSLQNKSQAEKERIEIVESNFKKKSPEIYAMINEYGVDSAISEFSKITAFNEFILGGLHEINSDFPNAINAYKNAIAKDSTNPEYYNDLGVVLNLEGEDIKAIESLKKALDLYENFRGEKTDNHFEAMARIYHNLATISGRHGQLNEADRFFQKSLNIKERLTNKNPNKYQIDLLVSYNTIGAFKNDLKLYSQADSILQKALNRYLNLTNEQQQKFQYLLASIYNNIGIARAKLGYVVKALSSYNKAIKIREKLVKVDFLKTRIESELSNSLNSVGALYLDQNNFNAAIPFLKNALEIRQKLANRYPHRYTIDLANTNYNIGQFHYMNIKPDSALTYLNQALKLKNEIKKENKTNSHVFLNGLAQNYNLLGAVYLDTKKYTHSNIAFEEAIDIFKKLALNDSVIYNLEVARVVVNTMKLKKVLLIETLDSKYKKEIELLEKDFHIYISGYTLNNKDVIDLNKRCEEILSDINKSEFDLEILKVNSDTEDLVLEIKNSKDIGLEIKNRIKIIEIFEEIRTRYPKEKYNKLAVNYGDLSDLYLKNNQYKKAEKSAIDGIKVDPTVSWIKVNLALSLLYQGKRDTAKEVIIEVLKEKTYRKVLLKELNKIEKEGVIIPDLSEIKYQLN